MQKSSFLEQALSINSIFYYFFLLNLTGILNVNLWYEIAIYPNTENTNPLRYKITSFI